MALQFFAVHSEALAYTHDSLQTHARAHGLRCPGPTRALRIAQLYGHLQLRSAGRAAFTLALCELAASWRLQPRQLRQDLALLQDLGWLKALGTTRGTVITLHDPQAATRQQLAEPDLDGPKTAMAPEVPATPLPGAERPAPPVREEGSTGRPLEARASGASLPSVRQQEQPLPISEPAKPRCSKSPAAVAGSQLLHHLAALYNEHKPSTWPTYQPRGNGLRGKVNQALKQAGGPEALAAVLIAALRGMPAFWRTTYPVGRSGAECMAALFSTDRGSAGLGVEFWHLFTWAQVAVHQPFSSCPDANDLRSIAPEDPLQKAQRLFLWDSGIWRGQGREALVLSLAEKRELASLLEANGLGIPGTAERQFADPEAELTPEPPSTPGPAAQPPQVIGAPSCQPEAPLARPISAPRPPSQQSQPRDG